MKERGTVQGRFGGFAIGHLTVSLLGFVLIWLGQEALDGISRATAVDVLLDLRTPAAVGLAVLLMLLYVPAGYVAARARRWPTPDRKTGVKAVLYPGFCAWGFAALGLVLMFGGSFLTDWGRPAAWEAAFLKPWSCGACACSSAPLSGPAHPFSGCSWCSWAPSAWI